MTTTAGWPCIAKPHVFEPTTSAKLCITLRAAGSSGAMPLQAYHCIPSRCRTLLFELRPPESAGWWWCERPGGGGPAASAPTAAAAAAAVAAHAGC
jgi:hypothetical protein